MIMWSRASMNRSHFTSKAAIEARIRVLDILLQMNIFLKTLLCHCTILLRMFVVLLVRQYCVLKTRFLNRFDLALWNIYFIILVLYTCYINKISLLMNVRCPQLPHNISLDVEFKSKVFVEVDESGFSMP